MINIKSKYFFSNLSIIEIEKCSLTFWKPMTLFTFFLNRVIKKICNGIHYFWKDPTLSTLGEFCQSVTKISEVICHKNLLLLWGFFYQRGTRKHSYWSKIFFGPMKIFSCPPSINKNIVFNKEVTNFCDKSRHLFL